MSITHKVNANTVTITMPRDFQLVSTVQGTRVIKRADEMHHWPVIIGTGFQRAVNDYANRAGKDGSEADKVAAGQARAAELCDPNWTPGHRGTGTDEPEINRFIRQCIRVRVAAQPDAKAAFDAVDEADRNEWLMNAFERLPDAHKAVVTTEAEGLLEADIAARKRRAAAKESLASVEIKLV